MGFLERLRASQAQQKEEWMPLTKISELENISATSRTKPIVIFKHSTTCGISAGAKQRLEIDWDRLQGDFEFYYLDLLSYRKVSNTIAEKWKVRHESPQILIIKDDEVVYHASHGSINASPIAGYL